MCETEALMVNIPRSEYPRPDFVRDNWICLNGEWEFSFSEGKYDRIINVPFSCESKMSGINDTSFHETVWYRKKFFLPEEMNEKKCILHFGAVDHTCYVTINGNQVSMHIGGQTSFSVDITNYVDYHGENTIELMIIDCPTDLEQMRGKQYWEKEPKSIFYTRTTGIWQSVWIEAVNKIHIEKVRITPLYDEKAVKFDYLLSQSKDATLGIEIFFKGQKYTELTVKTKGNKGFITASLDQTGLKAWNFYEDLTWSPETPRLFDVTYTLFHEDLIQDKVQSYFGMRKVSIENGKILLNNREYYQKLVLVQGYWPESLMTAPSDQAFVKDIECVKNMGFNGVRIHQKVEDPRFYYHADRLGLLVWGEIGAAYLYSVDYAQNMYNQWVECIMRDYNHPSIIVWVPLNESWGVQEIKTNKMQQNHTKAAYYITKSIDNTRVVIDNDGWEHCCGDMLTIHDYEDNVEIVKERYSDIDKILSYCPAGKNLYVDNYEFEGQPIIISEYGGICYKNTEDNDDKGWGYSCEHNEDSYIEHIKELTYALQSSKYIQGYCYTQLYDIETEQNGLLTFDRVPKIDIDVMKAINK